MNRRIVTLYYWLTKRNSVGVAEMFKFLVRPTVPRIAARYISGIEEQAGFQRVTLRGMKDCLYWPKEFELFLLHSMISEIMDPSDWHGYPHPQTPVTAQDVVVDVGAAEGLFSLLALQRGARVVAVEPHPVFVSSLQRTLGPYIPERATIIPAAAGDIVGEVGVPARPIIAPVGATHPGREGNVRMQPLDQLLSGLERVSFIKADVEGMEMPMLRGASGLIRRFHPKLAITCYHEENDYREMIRFVQGLVPEYHFALRGITHFHGKPLMIRFWVPEKPKVRSCA